MDYQKYTKLPIKHDTEKNILEVTTPRGIEIIALEPASPWIIPRIYYLDTDAKVYLFEQWLKSLK